MCRRNEILQIVLLVSGVSVLLCSLIDSMLWSLIIGAALIAASLLIGNCR